MFTEAHFIWMGICALFITALTYISVRFKFKFRTAAFIMAGISFVSEFSKIVTHMEFANGKDISKGMVIDPTALPLHLCSLLIFAFFYLPFCKNEKMKDFLLSFTVPVGIVGSLLAILMATSGTNFAAPNAYQCFIYHSGLIWFALHIIITKQAKLGIRPWLTNMATLICLAVSMIWVNGALQEYDTNFFYVVRPPVEGLPLLNLNNGWFVYFLTMVLIGFVSVSLVHLPFVIKEIKRK